VLWIGWRAGAGVGVCGGEERTKKTKGVRKIIRKSEV
jgi:hypothetical protein